MKLSRMWLVNTLSSLGKSCTKDSARPTSHVFCEVRGSRRGAPIMTTVCFVGFDPDRGVLAHRSVFLGGPEVFEEFTYFIEHKSLVKLLRKAGKGLKEVELTAGEDDSHFFVTLGETRFKVDAPFVNQDDIDTPDWIAPGEEEEVYNECWAAVDLYEAVKYASKAMSPDSSREHLHGVFFCPDGVIGTDGHRMHKSENFIQLGMVEGVIVPAPAVQALLYELEVMQKTFESKMDSVWVVSTKKHVRFEGPWQQSWHVVAKPVDCRYPPWKHVIPQHHEGQLVVEVKALERAVRSLMASGDNYAVRMRINGTFTLFDVQDNEINVPLKSSKWEEGRELMLGVNGEYLCDALTTANSTVTMKFNGPSDAITLDLGPTRMGVMMPMRV
jgi:hypothetical protein